LNNPSGYIISGEVTSAGLGLSGVALNVNGGTTNTTVYGSYWSSPLPPGGSFTITPSLAGYTFTPSSVTFSNVNSNQIANFSAVSTPKPLARIGVLRVNDPNCGGTVSGWYLDNNGDLAWEYQNGDTFGCFGYSADTPVLGDWTGNGHTKIGVYRSNDSNCGSGIDGWYLDANGDLAWEYLNGDRFGCFGISGDTPIIADWSGTGTAKIGVFRSNDSNCGGTPGWYLDVNGNLKWEYLGGDSFGCFGSNGDIPVVGDWNGTGKMKIGVFRPNDPNCSGAAGWYLDTNGNLKFEAGVDQSGCFGKSSDTPIVGDWTGSGTTKIGVARPNDSAFGSKTGFYLDLNGNLSFDSGDISGSIGLNNGTGLVGDFQGSGVARVGLLQTSDVNCSSGTASWHLDNGNLQFDGYLIDHAGCFGYTSDKPIIGKW
jgi:hypothetical protein